jgi:2-iminoacetate synthase
LFSEHYDQFREEAGQLRPFADSAAREFASQAEPGDAEWLRLLATDEFGSGGELDRLIQHRSEETKAKLSDRTVHAVVPIYVTSICAEKCAYCNYRSGNHGVDVVRARLSDAQLAEEAEYLVTEKGFHALELVYASDPLMGVDAMCRNAETLHKVLARHGGGLVGLSAESMDVDEYRQLREAGVTFSVLWQETYDRERYHELHPGTRRKSRFEYRLDAYERMYEGGIRDIGIGILTGLSPWRTDWAMLIRHEQYLAQQVGRPSTILGLPRLKPAPGAELQSTPFIPTDEAFVTTLALHNLLLPNVRPFVTTRESFEIGTRLAQGGGCLFTFNCTTIPGGYTMGSHGFQFPSGNYDAPVFSPKLAALGLRTEWDWRGYEEQLYTRAGA